MWKKRKDFGGEHVFEIQYKVHVSICFFVIWLINFFFFPGSGIQGSMTEQMKL